MALEKVKQEKLKREKAEKQLRDTQKALELEKLAR